MKSLTETSRPFAKLSTFPRALVRLSARAQRELWGLRLTRLYGFGIGFSYSIMLFTLPLGPSLSTRLWLKCLTTASWVAGIGALSLSRDLVERDTSRGLVSLARMRGFGEGELERARIFAGAIKLGTTVAIPGVMLALAGLLRFRTLSGAGTALSLLLFTALYAAVFGSVLALLARASSHALPGRGRLLLLAIVLGPWLLASGIGVNLPSVPAGLGWLLERFAGSRS